MKNRDLSTLISRLNNGTSRDLIQLRPLSETVDFAKVWIKRPKLSDEIIHSDGPYKFYFIKNNRNTYVATVLDMVRDLHWFVAKKYRKNGYLTTGMRSYILPHLFLNREEQRITVDRKQIGLENFKASEKIALNLGFIKTGDNEYLLKRPNYIADKINYGRNSEISEKRIEELRKKINYIGLSLWLIQTEIEMKYRIDYYTEELRELVGMIRTHTWKLEDKCWEYKRK